MDIILYFVLGSGGGSLIGWTMSSLVKGGEYKNRLAQVEKLSHQAPCPDISQIKTDIGEIKTDIKWLKKKYNGGEK